MRNPLKRYWFYASEDAMSWALLDRFYRLKTAKSKASDLGVNRPDLFVQINDAWKNHKKVHFIQADINALKSKYRSHEIIEPPKCCDE